MADHFRRREAIVRQILLVLLLCLGAAACGQKGGLYIPQDEPAPAREEPGSGN